MKNFFKKLAFVLALAMVVTAIAPAAQASAAAQPTLNATSKKIYIDGDYTGKYSDTFTLKVWNKGDYRVTFASSDTKIATVTKWYGVVTAKAVGTATITATVSNKTTGKVVKTLSSKVYVKKNADSVKFGSLAKFDQPLVVGDKVKINVARVAGTVTAWKQADKTQISDYTLWTSSNPEVATVDKWGTVKAIAAGETTISAVAMQTEGTVATTAPVTVKVTVVAKGITEVTQKTTTKLEVAFGAAQDTDKVTKSTLTITPADASKVKPLIKEVKWNDAKTVATVTVYTSLEDKVAYTVAVKDTDSKKDFVASVGEVASITLTKPATVVENVESKIEYVLKDANGIELPADDNKVTFELIDGEQNGYLYTNKVTVFEKGKTVTIQATYHTNDYSNEGVETVIKSNVLPVAAISLADTTLTSQKFTITKDGYPSNWDNVTQNLRVTLDSSGYKIEAYAKDSASNEYKSSNNKFKFESLDTSVLVVNESTGELYPITEGSVQVKVTAIDNEKYFIVTVTVTAKAKVAAFTFDKYSATVSNKANVQDEFAFVATLKDQYGNDITGTLSIEYGYNSSKDASKINGFVTVNGNKVEVDPSVVLNDDVGAYTMKVSCGDLSRIITVIVKKPGDPTAKRLVLSTNNVDLALNNSNDSEKAVTVNYYEVDKDGIKVQNITSNYDVIVKSPNGKELVSETGTNKFVLVGKDSANVLTKKVKVVSGTSFELADTKAGTYSVILNDKQDSTKTAVKSAFSVTDNQVKPVVKQNATSVDAQTSTLDTIKKAFSVTTSNKSEKVEITDAQVKFVGGTTITSGVTVIVKSIEVTETFDNGTFVHTINFDSSFKIK